MGVVDPDVFQAGNQLAHFLVRNDVFMLQSLRPGLLLFIQCLNNMFSVGCQSFN